jgi:acid phosphatase type 7
MFLIPVPYSGMRTEQRLTGYFLLFVLFGLPSNVNGQNRPSELHRAFDLQVPAGSPLRFVAFGDTRFHDPADKVAANASVRQAMVRAIDGERPAFISIGGDVVYTGAEVQDWQVWDSETALWREHHIPVYPALGNHDLKGDATQALANYFSRFPNLQQNRFYSLRFASCWMLVLDSSLDESSGPQAQWLQNQLQTLPDSVDFLFVVLHHPPYTSSSDEKLFGGGHSARSKEQSLANLLESRQQHMRARIVVFSGHVHNYEHHEHGGVNYFVTGGGGAHPYRISRKPTDVYQDAGVNYHYLLIDVAPRRAVVTMNKLDISDDGKQTWTKPDTVTITSPVNGSPARL